MVGALLPGKCLFLKADYMTNEWREEKGPVSFSFICDDCLKDRSREDVPPTVRRRGRACKARARRLNKHGKPIVP